MFLRKWLRIKLITGILWEKGEQFIKLVIASWKVGIWMKKVFKYKNGKIQVIYNEQFISKDYEDEYCSKKIEHKTNVISKSFTVGVEMMVHKGGRICYGMLVAQILPYDKPNAVKLSIAYTRENTIRYKESILYDDEFVYKGLPQEYVEQIYSSIYQLIKEKDIYPQCDISFEYSANCEVGSSPMIFGHIAEIIANMLYIDSIEEIFNMDIANFTNLYLKGINLIY